MTLHQPGGCRATLKADRCPACGQPWGIPPATSTVAAQVLECGVTAACMKCETEIWFERYLILPVDEAAPWLTYVSG